MLRCASQVAVPAGWRRQAAPEPTATPPDEGASLSAPSIAKGDVAVVVDEATGKKRTAKQGSDGKDDGRRQG